MSRKEELSDSSALKDYFKEIKKYPLLSFEQELLLSKRSMQGEKWAIQKLIEANLRLVVKIAKAYMSPDVTFMDLVQEGNLGLMKAAPRYDYRKNVRFSTYAAWWIKQSIVRALSNKRRSIRLPHRKEEALKKIQKSYSALAQKLCRTPSVEEVASDLEMRKEDIVLILEASSTVMSMDSDFNMESGNLYDIFEDNSYDPDRELMKKNITDETMKFLEKLLDREKQILLYRFSFYGGKKYTLKSIGEELGISPETVRQIEMRALKKLKAHADELREYVYS